MRIPDDELDELGERDGLIDAVGRDLYEGYPLDPDGEPTEGAGQFDPSRWDRP